MEGLNDESPMPFGKYKGTPMKDVPAQYLLFMWENYKRKHFNADVFTYIEENLDVLKKEIK